MKEKFRRFMIGRYGIDGYGRFLSIVSLVCVLLGLFLSPFFDQADVLASIGAILMLYCYYRMFSRKLQRRAQENYVYYGAKAELKNWVSRTKRRIAQMRTHKVFKCPHCKQKLRVPRGRGKISITCSKCKHEFIKRT